MCKDKIGMEWDAMYSTTDNDTIIWYFKTKSAATELMLTFG